MPESHIKPVPWLDDGEPPPRLGPKPDRLPRYAELHALSNFSFQRGASHPQELVRRAYNLGYEALAITDECSLAGVVRAGAALNDYRDHLAALERAEPGQRWLRPFRLLYGAEFDLGTGRLVALARHLDGWGGLCEFITAARRAAPKGSYRVGWDLSDFSLLAGCEVLYAPHRSATDSIAPCADLERAAGLFGSNLWLAVELPHALDDALWLAQLQAASARTGVPLVATGIGAFGWQATLYGMAAAALVMGVLASPLSGDAPAANQKKQATSPSRSLSLALAPWSAGRPRKWNIRWLWNRTESKSALGLGRHAGIDLFNERLHKVPFIAAVVGVEFNIGTLTEE